MITKYNTLLIQFFKLKEIQIILYAIYGPQFYTLMNLNDKDSKDDFPYMKILHKI